MQETQLVEVMWCEEHATVFDGCEGMVGIGFVEYYDEKPFNQELTCNRGHHIASISDISNYHWSVLDEIKCNKCRTEMFQKRRKNGEIKFV